VVVARMRNQDGLYRLYRKPGSTDLVRLHLPFTAITLYDHHMEKVDLFSHEPLHEQLAEIIRRAIESGELQPRQLLPSESALVSAHGVSRGTVRLALGKLREAGLVETFASRGTRVAAR
jgi:hypothetical protein